MRTAFLGIVLVSLAALVGTAFGGLVFGGLGEFQEKVVWSAVVGALFGSAAVLATVLLDRWRLPRFFPVGFAALCVAALLALALVWGSWEPGGVTWRLVTTGAIVMTTFSHVAFLTTFPSRRTGVWACRSVAMLMAIGVGFLVIGALWGGASGPSSGVYYAWLTAVLVLDVLGTLGVVLLSRRSRRLGRAAHAPQTAGGFPGTRPAAREPDPSF